MTTPTSGPISLADVAGEFLLGTPYDMAADVNTAILGVASGTNVSLGGQRGRVRQTTSSGSASGSGWSVPANIFFNPATITVAGGGVAPYLYCTGFGHSLPSNASVIGFQTQVVVSEASGSVGTTNAQVNFVKDGSTPVGNTYSFDIPTGQGASLVLPTSANYGNTGGDSFSYSEVNSANFGMRVSLYTPPGGNPQLSVLISFLIIHYKLT